METTYSIECQVEQRCSVEIGRWQNVAEKYTSLMRTVAIVDSAVADREAIYELFNEVIVVDGGESIKSLSVAGGLLQQLCDIGVDRQSVLVAIGGGTVTDVVGFVAATYMRGISCVFFPTTLLGQVDAAIGGKCAVNMGGYKNMVGAFALPKQVVCDTSWLASLPEREWRAGMAEVVKTAIIGDVALFELLENKTLNNFRNDADLCSEIVARCVAVKCDIVRRDLREAGERRLLNLGHTIAHAIESLSQEFSHGEAVAMGIVYASRKAVERGVLAPDVAELIESLLQRYDLPTELPLAEGALLEAVAHDKKSINGTPRWVLPTAIGRCIVEK